MKDIDVLLDLYKEQRDLGLHHENQRSAVSSLILSVSSILIGLIAFDETLDESDLSVAILVAVLGIFGALFTLKNYERFGFHRRRSRKLRKAIDAALLWGELHNDESQGVRSEIRNALGLLPDESSQFLLESLVAQANTQYKSQQHFLARVDLHKFWAALHLVIFLIGLLLMIQLVKA